jgi:hypothetical protein
MTSIFLLRGRDSIRRSQTGRKQAAAKDHAMLKIHDVVSFNAYLSDQSDIKTFVEVCDRIMGDHKPAATIVIVKGLARPALKIEIEVVAAKDAILAVDQCRVARSMPARYATRDLS